MEENMNEEALTADGQKDDDIDYVEDREELTEERIKDMLDAREYKELKEELETNMYPVDLAEILEEFDQKHMVLVFRLLAKEEAAETFSYMNSDMREDLINALTDSELEEIMEEMYLDDTVDVLEEMPANVVDRLLMVTDAEKRQQINQLLQYPEDSAGSVMNVDYIALRREMTVADSILKIRQVGLNRETIYTCYVTEQRHLIGQVDIKELLTSSESKTVEEIMDTNMLYARTTDDQEDVANIINTEKPYGVVVQFGGQTAIKLTRYLADMGVNILGTSADDIDAAEDRERFDELLGRCGIPRPAGETVMTTEEALKAANDLGYPVLMRPSYVLGGQNMIIAHSDKDIEEYMAIITSHMIENPVLIDKYMMGTEVEVDAICDGKDFLIPGIMEHVERAGVHSGDSISIYPAQNLSEKITDTIVRYTGLLAKELHAVGLINIQYVVYNNEVYVIEVNPRSSRTVPYISKVTGIPMVDIATKIMLGETLQSLGYKSGLYPKGKYVAVKVPVFSFEKLQDVDTMLGPEMKSTGECLGIATNLEDALLKGLIAAGYDLKKEGGVLISVRDSDKQEIIEIADKLARMGFELYGTSGTAAVLNHNMIATNLVKKISDGEPNTITLLESGKIHYMISTSAKGRLPARDSVKMRRKSVERSICCLTAIDTAKALANVLESGRSIDDVEMVDITKI